MIADYLSPFGSVNSLVSSSTVLNVSAHEASMGPSRTIQDTMLSCIMARRQTALKAPSCHSLVRGSNQPNSCAVPMLNGFRNAALFACKISGPWILGLRVEGL
jgi:hypothetical protein